MLVQLGQRAASGDLVDLLLECHERIRRFLGLARRLAMTPAAGEAEVREVAGQVRRYFAVSFPLHLADEDDLAARLAGDARTTPAIARMHADHVAHAGHVRQLVALCAAIEADPRQLAARAAELATAAEALDAEVEPHLALEEREIFPVVRALPPPDQDALRDAMRRRRDAVLYGAS